MPPRWMWPNTTAARGLETGALLNRVGEQLPMPPSFTCPNSFFEVSWVMLSEVVANFASSAATTMLK